MNDSLRTIRSTQTHAASAAGEPADAFARRRLVRIEPWIDHVTEEIGHDPRSAYVERFWLSVLGPSSLWLIRTLAYGFEAEPDGFNLNTIDVARALGIGDRVGRHSPLQRAVDRLCHFELAYLRGGVTLIVRPHVPWLDDFKVSRLPGQLQLEHQQWEAAALAESARTATKRRAAAVALHCARTGGTADDVRRALVAWHYDPVGTEELTAWAMIQVEHRSICAA